MNKPLSEKELDYSDIEMTYDYEMYCKSKDIKTTLKAFKEDMSFKKPNEEISISTLAFNQMFNHNLRKHFGSLTDE